MSLNFNTMLVSEIIKKAICLAANTLRISAEHDERRQLDWCSSCVDMVGNFVVIAQQHVRSVDPPPQFRLCLVSKDSLWMPCRHSGNTYSTCCVSSDDVGLTIANKLLDPNGHGTHKWCKLRSQD